MRVINAPFHAEPAPKVEAVPLWQQPWLQDLLRAGAAPAALTLVALLLIFSLVRPALKAALAPPPAPVGGQLDAVVADAETLPDPDGGHRPALAGPTTQDKLAAARQLAKENPAGRGQHHAQLGQRRTGMNTLTTTETH